MDGCVREAQFKTGAQKCSRAEIGAEKLGGDCAQTCVQLIALPRGRVPDGTVETARTKPEDESRERRKNLVSRDARFVIAYNRRVAANHGDYGFLHRRRGQKEGTKRYSGTTGHHVRFV